MTEHDLVEKWTEAEIADLKDGVECGLSIEEMTKFFMRSAREVEAQIGACGFRAMAEAGC